MNHPVPRARWRQNPRTVTIHATHTYDRRGYAALDEELKNLKSVERPAIIQAIAEAREHGDLSENAEYHAAKEKQSFIEGRIVELEDKLSRADVIDLTKVKGDKIVFGATVTIIDVDTEDELTYQIVGEDEADIAEGKVSNTSPWPGP